MNDERFQKSKHCINNNNNNNHISSKLKKCNNITLKSEYNLAEAAKVSLKNVLNGANKETIIAAAKLLNATKAFHFSPPPLPPTAPPQTPSTVQQQQSKHLTVKAADPFAQKLQQSLAVVNNGLSSLSTKAGIESTTECKIDSMAAIASTPIVHVGGGGVLDAGLKMATDCEVIDYTINNLKNNNNNNNNNSNNNNNNNNNNTNINNNTNNNNNSRINCDSRNSDHDRQQYGGLYGGRLQFFKDGKFILELARSKDGERSGWVSVPRKPMRPPSATSSTITPTSATSLVAYPKNESSTSLSFSDDNSSIQSSPWQRDHCWKQATPKRNVSKEMCLYFKRPNETQLTEAALKVAHRKRRQPLNKLTLALSVKMFQRLHMNDEYEEKCSTTAENVETKMEKEEKLVAPKEHTDTLNSAESSPKDLNSSNSLEQSADNKNIKMKEEVEENENERAKEKAKDVCDETNIVKSNTIITTKTEDNDEHKEKDTEFNSNGIMQNNTSKSNDDEHKEVETTTEMQTENNNKNIDTNKENDMEIDAENRKENIKKSDVKRKRLKVFKERAKLDTIVQKLNQRVLRDTEQQQLTTTTTATTTSNELSGNGLTTKNSVSLHKNFSTPNAAATRLADFHHQHVSPRKRILRELEKVTLEDAGAKRSRAKMSNNNFTLTTANSCSPTRIQTKLPTTTTTNTTATAMDISSEKTVNTSSCTDANTTPTTTRLYSSYSIHSLLSGSSSSSSNNNSNKKPTISYDKQPNQQNVDAYQRNLMLGSPKSPEHAKLYKKRSPPYTPENSQHQQHLHAHHLAEHHQGFHTPYMLSPKYMARPTAVSDVNTSTTITTTTTTNYNNNNNNNNIPKNVPTSSNTTTSYTSQHTANASAFTAAAAAVNLLSPQSTTATVDSTPRTVPKKTPSIRRQFASPTTLAASPPTAAATTTSALNENDIYMPHSGLPPHWPAVSSAPSMHAPLHFYMYPPAPHPPVANGSSANEAAVAAAAAAAYIPYYHPYFTTLAALRQNPLWLHHYAGHHAATRLSPPTYASNSSNFLGPTGNSPSMASYMPTPNSRAMLGNNSNNNNNKMYGGTGVSKTPETLTYNNNNHNKLASSTTAVTLSSKQRTSTPTSTTTSTMSSASSHGVGSYKSGNIKDEPSSDVPLNLSKH